MNEKIVNGENHKMAASYQGGLWIMSGCRQAVCAESGRTRRPL